MTGVRIHPTAIVEPDVELGAGTAVWDSVHIRSGARIGRDCIIGEKTYIAGGVVIGDRVKVNAMAYLCAGVTLEDGVMVAAGVIFANDRYPRAATPDLSSLRPSCWDEEMMPTHVGAGATIGAGSRIGCGLSIGAFALIGMGSVVTRSVPRFALAYGNPAQLAGHVCRCGHPVDLPAPRPAPADHGPARLATCGRCGRRYGLQADGVVERPADVAVLDRALAAPGQ